MFSNDIFFMHVYITSHKGGANFLYILLGDFIHDNVTNVMKIKIIDTKYEEIK